MKEKEANTYLKKGNSNVTWTLLLHLPFKSRRVHTMINQRLPHYPETTRHRNRKLIVLNEEHPFSSIPKISPSHMRGRNSLRSRIPSQIHTRLLVKFYKPSISHVTRLGEAIEPMFPILLWTELKSLSVDANIRYTMMAKTGTSSRNRHGLLRYLVGAFIIWIWLTSCWSGISVSDGTEYRND